VKINLLTRSDPIRPAGVDELTRDSVMRKVADVFEKQVGARTDLPFDDEGRF
jgi:hypothetical protein